MTPLDPLIFDPLRGFIGKSRTVFISPDGELCRLPFATLPEGENGHLLDSYDFAYLSSGRDISAFARARTKSSRSTVVFAPDYDAGLPDIPPESDRFENLQGTAQEGFYIKELLDAIPLSGASATKAEIERLSSPLILHLATHGFFIDAKPETNKPDLTKLVIESQGDKPGSLADRLASADPLFRVGLAMAGANSLWLPSESAAANGVLLAAEIPFLDLSGTELVVLSACDTARGKIIASQGVIGLARTFLIAGARTVVASQWRVQDEATVTLMTSFYGHLRDGNPRHRALGLAQAELRDKKFGPYLWGAFVCIGYSGSLVATDGKKIQPFMSTEIFHQRTDETKGQSQEAVRGL